MKRFSFFIRNLQLLGKFARGLPVKKGFMTALGLCCAVQMLLVGCGAEKVQTAAPAKTQSAFAAPQYDWGPANGETLTLWAQENELDRSYIRRALARYQKLGGNKLEITEIPADAFKETVARAFASPDADKPDLLLSYGGTNVEKFKPDDNFYDFTNAPWVQDLTATSINQTIYNGKVIGLPHWEASISGTLYNKKLFQKYGLQPPSTQAEFMEVCRVLKEAGVTPVYLPYAGSSMLLYQLPLDTLVQDSKIISGLNSGTGSYGDLPGMEKIVQWYRDMAQNGYFGEDYEQNDWDGMSPALESEKYAMMLCWDTWLYSDYKGDPSDFGLMPAFIGVPDEGTFEGPNLALLIVNKNSPRLDAAVGFISFMADPYNYNVAFEGFYSAPVFRQQVGSISTPQYVEVERLIDKHFRSSTAWLRIRGFSQMDASFIQAYMKDNAGMTAADCIHSMDAARRKRMYG